MSTTIDFENLTQEVHDAMTDAERLQYDVWCKERKIKEYLKTGEIGSSLSLHATLAMCHAETAWDSIKPEYAALDKKWIKTLARVVTEVEDMHLKMKEFEFKHWMGFCDLDVQELLIRYREWEHFDWQNATKEEGDAIRSMWNPSPMTIGDYDKDDYWREPWQPYIDRRSRTPLQQQEHWGSAQTKTMKIMMGSSGGRVLLTLRDRYEKGHAKSAFGGAWITLIFDENAGWPRGGIQGHCATRDEGVGLIQAVIDHMPKLKPDSNLSIC